MFEHVVGISLSDRFRGHFEVAPFAIEIRLPSRDGGELAAMAALHRREPCPRIAEVLAVEADRMPEWPSVDE